VFHIIYKGSPITFYAGSHDPASPFFGYDSKVQYGMEFLDGGFYIHDTWWRTTYGPPLTANHYDPGRGEYEEGSHGCVNTPLEMMAWLYVWTPEGTPVIIA
jgi:lipoprotein-anchoring transpeptidase ErfK/SrfK